MAAAASPLAQISGLPDAQSSIRRAKAAGWPAKYGPAGQLAVELKKFAGAIMDDVENGGVVLDLGCGSGRLARFLAALSRAYRVSRLHDISARMLGHASAADHRRAVT